MAVSATLRVTDITVPPGGNGRCHVLIRNNSAVVDQFVFTVRGDVAEWTDVKPARVNLLPHQEVPVELTFSPPRTPDVLAGEHPFALQVASREDAAGSVVQEGVVTVTKFVAVEADIVPRTSEGRFRGPHTLAIDNLGNHEHGVEVMATDPDNRLTFRIKPHGPLLAPGTASFVRVVARPKRRFWKGENRPIPFLVKVVTPGEAPVEIEATVEQRPILPRRFFVLFAALFAIVLILAVIIAAILRQRPVSIAGPSPTRPASTAPSVTATTAPSTAGAPTSGRPTVTPTRGSGGGSGGSTRTSNAAGSTAEFVVQAQAFPGVTGGPQEFSYVVPDRERYRVTTVVLRNPDGDTGRVDVRHGTRVLASFDLAAVDRAQGDAVTQRFPTPPTVRAGELVTLAVTCANRRDPCTPSATFTATRL